MDRKQIEELARKLNSPSAGNVAAATFGPDVVAPEPAQESTPEPTTQAVAAPDKPLNLTRTEMEQLILLLLLKRQQDEAAEREKGR